MKSSYLTDTFLWRQIFSPYQRQSQANGGAWIWFPIYFFCLAGCDRWTNTWKVNGHCRIPEQAFIFFCFGANQPKLIQRKYVPLVLTAIFPGDERWAGVQFLVRRRHLNKLKSQRGKAVCALIHPRSVVCPSKLHMNSLRCEHIEALYALSLWRHIMPCLGFPSYIFKHLCSRWCYRPSLETLALFEGF